MQGAPSPGPGAPRAISPSALRTSALFSAFQQLQADWEQMNQRPASRIRARPQSQSQLERGQSEEAASTPQPGAGNSTAHPPSHQPSPLHRTPSGKNDQIAKEGRMPKTLSLQDALPAGALQSPAAPSNNAAAAVHKKQRPSRANKAPSSQASGGQAGIGPSQAADAAPKPTPKSSTAEAPKVTPRGVSAGKKGSGGKKGKQNRPAWNSELSPPVPPAFSTSPEPADRLTSDSQTASAPAPDHTPSKSHPPPPPSFNTPLAADAADVAADSGKLPLTPVSKPPVPPLNLQQAQHTQVKGVDLSSALPPQGTWGTPSKIPSPGVSSRVHTTPDQPLHHHHHHHQTGASHIPQHPQGSIKGKLSQAAGPPAHALAGGLSEVSSLNLTGGSESSAHADTPARVPAGLPLPPTPADKGAPGGAPGASRTPAPPASRAPSISGGGFRRRSSAGSSRVTPPTSPRATSPSPGPHPDPPQPSVEARRPTSQRTSDSGGGDGADTAAAASAATSCAGTEAGAGQGTAADGQTPGQKQPRDPAFLRKLSALKRAPPTHDQLLSARKAGLDAVGRVTEEQADQGLEPIPVPQSPVLPGGSTNPDDLSLSTHARMSQDVGPASVKASMLAQGASHAQAALAALASTRPGSRGRVTGSSDVIGRSSLTLSSVEGLNLVRSPSPMSHSRQPSPLKGVLASQERVASPVVLGSWAGGQSRSRPTTSPNPAPATTAPTTITSHHNAAGQQVSSEVLVVEQAPQDLSHSTDASLIPHSLARANSLHALARQRSYGAPGAGNQTDTQQQQQHMNSQPSSSQHNQHNHAGGLHHDTQHAQHQWADEQAGHHHHQQQHAADSAMNTTMVAPTRTRARWNIPQEEDQQQHPQHQQYAQQHMDQPPPLQSRWSGGNGSRHLPPATHLQQPADVFPRPDHTLPAWATLQPPPPIYHPPPVMSNPWQQALEHPQQPGPHMGHAGYPPSHHHHHHQHHHPHNHHQLPNDHHVSYPDPRGPRDTHVPPSLLGYAPTNAGPPLHMPPIETYMHSWNNGSNHVGSGALPPHLQHDMQPGGFSYGMPQHPMVSNLGMQPGLVPQFSGGALAARPSALLTQGYEHHVDQLAGGGGGWDKARHRGPSPVGAAQDVPDYLRLSSSKYTTGWAASPWEAAAGPLSAFADVWKHRQGAAGYGQPQAPQPQYSPVPGAAYRGAQDMQQERRQAAQQAFEGMSLAEVLASAPKKEVPFPKRKGPPSPTSKPPADEP